MASLCQLRKVTFCQAHFKSGNWKRCQRVSRKCAHRDDRRMSERRDGASRSGRENPTSREARRHHHRSRGSRSRSRDRSGRRRGHGGSSRRRSPTPPRGRGRRGHRSRSRSRDRDGRCVRLERSTPLLTGESSYAPSNFQLFFLIQSHRISSTTSFHHNRRRHRSRSASSGSEYGYVPRHRQPAGSFGRDDVRGKAGLSIHGPLLTANGLGSSAVVDAAAAQAERRRQAQHWIAQQQASGFSRLGGGGGGDGLGNKKSKEIFVGNLLFGVVTVDTLKTLFDSSLSVAFPNANPLIKPVVHVQMASDMKYAFIQLQTEEMASAAIQLNGMELCGREMTIARPSGFVDPSLAAAVAAQAALLLEKGAGSAPAAPPPAAAPTYVAPVTPVVPSTAPSIAAPAPAPAVP